MNEVNFLYFLKNQCNIKLTKEQRIAVLTGKGPIALIAVPGGGKTTVIESRTANLILNYNIDPSSILTLTFSKASSKDILERFNKRFGNIIDQQVYFATIHSFAKSEVIKAYECQENIKYTVIEGNNTNGYSKVNLLKRYYREHTGSNMTTRDYKGLCNYISYRKNSRTVHSKPQTGAPGYYNDIYKDYEEEKRKRYLIDYDDMLTLCYDILNTNPNILEKLRNKYKYIQIDECQDISWIQHQIIKLIAAPLNNVLYVGDEDQAIYGFRGASSEILYGFDKEFKEAKILFMQENFRSTPNIVKSADHFIRSNNNRFSQKNMITNRHQGDEIKIINCNNELHQVRLITQELSKSNLTNVAILYRNNIASIPVINQLVEDKIPFYIKSYEDSFFNHWVTKDILAFLDLSSDLSDIDALEKMYYKFQSYISKEDIRMLKSIKSNESVFQMLANMRNISPNRKNQLKAFEDLFRHIGKMRPHEAIKSILDDAGYKNYLKNSDSTEDLNDIASSARIISVGVNNIGDYKEKLRTIYNMTKKSSSNRENNMVTLSTIHSAKGLEFDTVFMIDVLEGTIPSKEIGFSTGHSLIEEERRLFYVGITRAKNNLYLLSPKYKNGEVTSTSRFIKEINKGTDLSRNQAVISSNQDKSITKLTQLSYKNGKRIKHKTFGYAVITNIDGDIVSIKTSDGVIKKLSISACIQNNYIEAA